MYVCLAACLSVSVSLVGSHSLLIALAQQRHGQRKLLEMAARYVTVRRCFWMICCGPFLLRLSAHTHTHSLSHISSLHGFPLCNLYVHCSSLSRRSLWSLCGLAEGRGGGLVHSPCLRHPSESRGPLSLPLPSFLVVSRWGCDRVRACAASRTSCLWAAPQRRASLATLSAWRRWPPTLSVCASIRCSSLAGRVRFLLLPFFWGRWCTRALFLFLVVFGWAAKRK
jgi:hypothetical protein